MSHKGITGVSPRFAVALELSDTCVCAGLSDNAGVVRSKGVTKAGKNFYKVTFCRAGVVDGSIEIYSPYFIVVKYNQNGRKHEERCTGPEQAKRFMTWQFL